MIDQDKNKESIDSKDTTNTEEETIETLVLKLSLLTKNLPSSLGGGKAMSVRKVSTKDKSEN